MDVISLRNEQRPARAGKIAGFDAVRAGAALGVVLLHSFVPYTQPRMPGLSWPVQDSPHWLTSLSFWAIELFIMPLFLVIAGYLAWQTLERSGGKKLITSRARRLLVPLLFGIVVVLPLDLYAWLLGWVSEGLIPLQKLRSLKFDGEVDQHLWGLSHLWFLQYLFLYVVAMVGAMFAWGKFPRRVQDRVSGWLLIAMLSVVACVTLYLHPEVVWGFQHSFFPVASKWIYSGVFFAIGAVLAAQDSGLMQLKACAGRLVAPAMLLAMTALAMGTWHLRGGENDLASTLLAAATFTGALTVTLAIVGAAAARVKTVPVAVSYLAAASFWVYIVHHPILGVVHTDLKWLWPQGHPVVKASLAFVVTTSVSLVTYEIWVRRTRLGRWLGFQWTPPVTAGTETQEVSPEVISIGSDSEATEPPARRAA